MRPSNSVKHSTHLLRFDTVHSSEAALDLAPQVTAPCSRLGSDSFQNLPKMFPIASPQRDGRQIGIRWLVLPTYMYHIAIHVLLIVVPVHTK